MKIFDGLNKGIKIVSKILYLTGVSAKTSVTHIRPSESCIRDCAIIIRRGEAEKLEVGALHKIAAKMEGGGAQSKITHLTEGGFKFYSKCK